MRLILTGDRRPARAYFLALPRVSFAVVPCQARPLSQGTGVPARGLSVTAQVLRGASAKPLNRVRTARRRLKESLAAVRCVLPMIGQAGWVPPSDEIACAGALLAFGTVAAAATCRTGPEFDAASPLIDEGVAWLRL